MDSLTTWLVQTRFKSLRAKPIFIHRAQYTVLVPALWATEAQDWELKCMNSLVLDDGHHGPKAGTTQTHSKQLFWLKPVMQRDTGDPSAHSRSNRFSLHHLTFSGTHADPVTHILVVLFSCLHVDQYGGWALGRTACYQEKAGTRSVFMSLHYFLPFTNHYMVTSLHVIQKITSGMSLCETIWPLFNSEQWWERREI